MSMASAVSLSSPRFSARRHLNTWFAFTPCARATSATLAPGSKVSSAIRRFSDTVRHRRDRPSSTYLPLITHDDIVVLKPAVMPEGNSGRLQMARRCAVCCEVANEGLQRSRGQID